MVKGMWDYMELQRP